MIVQQNVALNKYTTESPNNDFIIHLIIMNIIPECKSLTIMVWIRITTHPSKVGSVLNRLCWFLRLFLFFPVPFLLNKLTRF